MPDNAFGYVRVSTDEQANLGVSLDAQRQRIAAFCQLHDLELSAIFADEGLSGSRADNRPGLNGVLNAACRAKSPIVVYSLSRLARSTSDAIAMAERLADAGADLISITERIDTTTGMGRFFFTTVAALAQLERDLISERTTAALAHKRSKGERIGGIPLGFDVAADGKHLVANADEQRVVEAIHRFRAEGMSARRIITRLDAMGMTPKGGGKWHPKVILDVCRRIDVDAG